MQISALKNKKKILFPVIAALLLVLLVGGAAYSLLFVRDTFRETAGELDGAKAVGTQFDFQKMRNLGIGI